MNRFFSADFHLGHRLQVLLDEVGASSAEERDELILGNINKIVKPNDELYILGDVFLCSKGRAKEYAKRLPKKTILVLGNHDKELRSSSWTEYFKEIHPHRLTRTFDGIPVIMDHHPIYSWDRRRYGSFHLHGHIHRGQIPWAKTSGKIMNVGIMCHEEYRPFHWDEVVAYMANRPIFDEGVTSHHGY